VTEKVELLSGHLILTTEVRRLTPCGNPMAESSGPDSADRAPWSPGGRGRTQARSVRRRTRVGLIGFAMGRGLSEGWGRAGRGSRRKPIEQPARRVGASAPRRGFSPFFCVSLKCCRSAISPRFWAEFCSKRSQRHLTSSAKAWYASYLESNSSKSCC